MRSLTIVACALGVALAACEPKPGQPPKPETAAAPQSAAPGGPDASTAPVRAAYAPTLTAA